ncbi:MAG: acetyl-CoA carboxylase carboxyltransferase subunit alpha [candidate division NC10 bacterium]|nr:acetyl-CoA carboxylase carboxyltransferase subunit alpha [candidate division NC10 bacterium]
MAEFILDFERRLVELEEKIKEIKHYAAVEKVDFGEEVKKLERKAAKLRKEVYSRLTPWQRTQLARHPARPYTLDYIRLLMTDFIELAGDRFFSQDPAIVGGLAKFDGQPVVVIGHQKGRDTKENLRRNFAMPHPEGYRKALRLMKLAEKFGKPVITFVDTPGAYPGIGAEERGQAEAIARNLREMSELRTPILVVVTGEGGSGGALALGVGDVILMLEYSIYSVISPEGCAAILWKDSSKAPEAAQALGLTAQTLKELEVIDEIVPEPAGGAHRDPAGAAHLLKGYLSKYLQELQGKEISQLLEERYQKFRKMGRFKGE